MLVEFNFFRNQLDLTAGEVQKRIVERLNSINFGETVILKTITVMSKWLVILIDFPDLTEPPPFHRLFDGVAGSIVAELIDYGVRYRHFTVLGEGPSLIFK